MLKPDFTENLHYQLPPKEILQLADYERSPSVETDMNNRFMLFCYRNTYKSLEDINQPEISFAGIRLNPLTCIKSEISYINNLKVGKTDGSEAVQVTGLPFNPRIAYINWSPNETQIAFTNTTLTGVEVWVLDVETAHAKKLTEAVINASLGNPINWIDDNCLITRFIPEKREPVIDPNYSMPTGPIVDESDGEKAQNRTYQDLLKNPIDERNFVIFATSELFKIELNGKAELFKEADIYANINVSPDRNYILITTIKKPFSYLVPYNRFANCSVICNLNGDTMHIVNDVPLSEVLPQGFMAVRKGKRAMNWRSDLPATLSYVEALDQGDPLVEAEYRDAIFQWDILSEAEPKLLAKIQHRFSDILWCNSSLAIIQDYWYDTRQTKTYLINPTITAIQPTIIHDRNFQDIYSDPGYFEMVRNNYGKYVLAIDNDTLFLIGEGFTPTGQFPFIDNLNVTNLKTERLYQSTLTEQSEEILTFHKFTLGEVLVRIQAKNEFPNYYLRNIKQNTIKQLTRFPNPFESIKNVHKELIKYNRPDGVELSGTLYLPADYDVNSEQKLPLLIWAYPAEYKDKDSAGQTDTNPNKFTYPYYDSFVYWVTRGYAVLDDASFPIVGEGKTEPNDNFIDQLIANAKAAIDAVNELGYINPEKVAVGGHSYGAFMVANLLTHSNLFACGVARSGAYNRTLTPFGFQAEQRNYWEARKVYDAMSPYNYADKMKTPILLVHGEADNNSGTFKLQTERYYQALKGLGAPARMVILPKESHGYVARENILHLLWEQDRFFEKYLK
ncbi:MAG TPA: prolyl oligopeptidase family serine peptidase [Paludibacter sp.]|nr:prolyl oligopeptidase family serine peptidase [Paludibacter sp.]